MTIHSLVKMLMPPNNPSESGAGQTWPKFDGEIDFPGDYVEFISLYGTGRVADFVAVFNPFSKNENVNFFEQSKLVLEDFRYLVESDGENYTYSLYPEVEGLIPVAVTDNGDYIFWVCNSKDNSDHWSTAMVPARSPEVEFFDCGLTALLEGVLSGKLKANSLADGFPSVINFEPM